ncbi:LysE family transporter [Brevibacillus centrosporus]|uniref:LysE family translocator n=1 Tax=Brevibacillus centrosporus TaxID=54910 RepID=UPI000F09C8D5|nr:LysE family transporter [Brevibacillus centrosporus]MEC2130775.1 LysE family transporter [Brevibacillus centrosporus]RNB69194.1 LysE family translocator [Brevibacillus centrosporus]GED32206.1 amino acid transporter LysE [Brevibacillus centrosporus]
MNLTSLLIYCFIVTFTPGPTNIVILSTVNNFGTKKAMEYTYGATVAFGLLLAVSAMLNTMLLTFLPKILLVMQIIGTIYMFYLAYQIYKMDTSASPTVNQAGTFASGFFMQFVNPKVILFTMTVIPSYVLPFDTSMPAVALSAFAITLIGFFAFVTWVLFGTIFKQFLQAHKKIVNVIMALFLGFAAIVMWM